MTRARPLRAREKALLWAAGGLLWKRVYRRHHRPIQRQLEQVRGVVMPVSVDRSWRGIASEAFSRFSEDEAQMRGAALSYYTMFSIAPLLLILMSLVGLFAGSDAARAFIDERVGGLLGERSAGMIAQMVEGAQTGAGKGVAGLVGVVVLLFGAAGVVQALQTSLDKMWGSPPAAGGLGGFVRGKLLSMAFVLGLGFLLLVSLVLSAAIAALAKWTGGFLPLPPAALQAVNAAVSFGSISLLFALMFKFLPRSKPTWGDVWIGALVTGLLFQGGNWLLAQYLGKAGPASTYGAAGSLLAVMLWAYYCAQILFFGAEFTRVYAQRRGSGLPALKEG